MHLAEPLPGRLEQPKKALSHRKRAVRAVFGVLDPRAWVHLFRLVNFYNHTHVIPRRRITLGRGVAISPTASFANAEHISLGDGSHVGTHCYLWAGRTTVGKIEIGRHLLLGPNVFITASSYRFNSGSPVTQQPMKEAPVIVGDDVWIGANAVVLPGCTIGDGAIIAAGAIVRENVPAGAIMAGAPAKQVGIRNAL